jgi:ankyrin repeat protein
VTHRTLAYPSHEASRLRRIRQYAVPGWMIEQATERRLDGDWRGACAAAGVDVALDLAEVAKTHGDAVATAFEDDLRHFAPDLLRWHLPRLDRGRTTIVPDQKIILSRPAPGAPCLYVVTPSWMAHGPQRLRLLIGPVSVNDWGASLETDWFYCAFWRDVVHDWTASRHLWDARHAGELRDRCGGDAVRAPFLHADGTPRTADELPAADPGRADPAAFTEWVTLLHERGEVEAAFAAAGIELDTAPVEIEPWFSVDRVDPVEVVARMPLALAQVEAEIQRLGADRFWVPYRQYAGVVFERSETGLRVRLVQHEPGDEPSSEVLPEACWRRLPDLDLLRDGFPPDRLHPLVREALLPGRAAGEPPAPEPAGPVRVRCRTEWHEVSFRDGVLDIPHTEEEQRREDALRALGGATAGCFAARHAWTSGTGRLPRILRDQRKDLFARFEHGDTPGVVRLLDAGVDPRVRDARQRTLLHVLHLVDHEPLLGRLLAAGLDIDARDEAKRTPLFAAICGGGSVALVEALLAAGARIDLSGNINGEAVTLHRLITWLERDELNFIVDRIEAACPELIEEE